MGYTISATAATGNQTCQADKTCTCPNGTPTTVGGTAGTLCETDGSVDCSACKAGYTISATAATGNQTCQATGKTCACPNGTPTIAGGTAGTLCETDGIVDCSACKAGHTISA